MNVVVLDGYTLNPGDLSWKGLESLGALTVYDRTPPELILERAEGAGAVLVNKVALSAATLQALKSVRYAGVLATGYDMVDVGAARELGITVTNVPSYGTDSVAQLTIALLLELCHQAAMHSAAVRAGEWSRSKDWCFWRAPLVELAGKRIGVIGLGRIGGRVAQIAAALGMSVLATGEAAGNRRTPSLGIEVQWVPLEELLTQADVVTLHCPLTPVTKDLINANRLALMKPTAFLINTSRGGLIADQDLAEALNYGRLAGAGLDVLGAEPPPPGNPLLRATNCITTPHLAWATREARARLMQAGAENLAAF
ncbi:MAG: D-2-hydroxyacid dehydrogenase, partial [Terriglobia bacterium]